uniref:Tektin like 1 n=1 Tax=Gadus morhua TaxID=8049 RepID=A0A8C5FS31_GADMO
RAMSVQQVPLGSVTIGAPAWRESTELSLRRACRLLRQTGLGPGGTAAARPRTPPTLGCPKHASTEDKTEKHGDTTEDDGNGRDHAASLRERCARQSTATAGEYMRWVREVELRLRRQAGRSSQEIAKLERERAHLEMMLRSIRNDLQVNRESAGQRTERRPRDGADLMLAWERRELTEMKHDVEETLRKTQQQVDFCLVVVYLSFSCRLLLLPGQSESEQVLDSSSLAINQSQRLREQIRHALSEVVARQRASQHVVNGGLVKKVAETVTLERSLVLTAAATRHAASRKQREVDSLRLSHGRAQGPESSSDVFCRERLGRPVVQVYQRHPGTELPEATHLLQGSAVLGYRLGESEDDAARLRRCFLQLCGEARGKRAAARRDTTVVRMRLQRGDKRVIPHILQQGEPKVTQEDDPCSHRNINEGPQ